MIDFVIDRREMKAAIARALRFMGASKAASPAPATTVPATEPAPQT